MEVILQGYFFGSFSGAWSSFATHKSACLHTIRRLLKVHNCKTSSTCPHQPWKPAHHVFYLFWAVKVSLCWCGPLYTTLLSPWLARAPSVRAMEPMAEGWIRKNIGKYFPKTKTCVDMRVCTVAHLVVHWRFGEGRDCKRQHFVLSILVNYFLWQKRKGGQEKIVSSGKNEERGNMVRSSIPPHFSAVCDHLICLHFPLLVSVCVYAALSACCVMGGGANHRVLMFPGCMLMSNKLMGDSQGVDWQLTFSAILTGSKRTLNFHGRIFKAELYKTRRQNQ